jgi:hypothetical protein
VIARLPGITVLMLGLKIFPGNLKCSFMLQVPGFPEWFNIQYDSEKDIIYTYRLADDLTKGDLRIVV